MGLVIASLVNGSYAILSNCWANDSEGQADGIARNTLQLMTGIFVPLLWLSAQRTVSVSLAINLYDRLTSV